jgi:hypothetical protein
MKGEATGAILFHRAQSAFRNTGARTGFDALRVHHGLDDPTLAIMALVVRRAETNDRALTPWSAGLWAIGGVAPALELRPRHERSLMLASSSLHTGRLAWASARLGIVWRPVDTAGRVAM